MLDFDPGKWVGLDNLGEEALESLRAGAADGVEQAVMHLEEAVKQTLKGQRSGRVYQVSKTGKLHTASAPGEPPAVLWGQLRRSITHSRPRWDGWTIAADVGTNVEYARRLEFGGIHTTKFAQRAMVAPGVWRTVPAGTVIRILPRPYFEPTVLRELARIEAILERSLRAA